MQPSFSHPFSYIHMHMHTQIHVETNADETYDYLQLILCNTSATRGKGDYQIDYVPAPRVTEADKTNDRK